MDQGRADRGRRARSIDGGPGAQGGIGHPPPGRDDNVVEPENIPPTLSEIVQNARLEWSGWLVAHTWLDLNVVTTDNSAVATVIFVFKDTGAEHEGLRQGASGYRTTFEIDFWSDHMWGYEVEAHSYDLAGNVMAKTAGGGLTYLIGKLVAGFLSFLLGPAIGGAVFGFFLGMLVGLFEDLSIFLQIGEIAKAITELPKLIGQLAGNPSMLVALFVDMITAHMTRCMMVNPYGTPPGTTEQWADWVAKRFFGQEPGGTDNRIVFAVACTVGSIVGYMVQQFIIGTGIAKVLGKLKDAGKFASLGKKLSEGGKALGKAVDRAKAVGKSVKDHLRGTAEAVQKALEDVGIKFTDGFWGRYARPAARMGCSPCHDWAKAVKRLMDKFDNLVKNKLDDFKKGLLESKYRKHAQDFGLDPNDLSPANLDAFTDLARDAARSGRKGVYSYKGMSQYGFLHHTADGRPYFIAADEFGDFVRIHRLSSASGFADGWFLNLEGLNEFLW